MGDVPCGVSDLLDELAIGMLRVLRRLRAQYMEVLADSVKVTFPDGQAIRIPECRWCSKQETCPLRQVKEVEVQTWNEQAAKCSPRPPIPINSKVLILPIKKN